MQAITPPDIRTRGKGLRCYKRLPEADLQGSAAGKPLRRVRKGGTLQDQSIRVTTAQLDGIERDANENIESNDEFWYS